MNFTDDAKKFVFEIFYYQKTCMHDRNTFVNNRGQCSLRHVAIRDYSIPMPDCLHVQSLIGAMTRPTHHSS